MKLVESFAVERPPAEVLERLAAPERPAREGLWGAVEPLDGGYRASLRAGAGAVEIDLDCRFTVERRGEEVRVAGDAVSPRLAVVFDARFSVRPAAGGSAVAVEADLAVSGPLAGLGQRRVGEQARRLLAAYVR